MKVNVSQCLVQLVSFSSCYSTQDCLCVSSQCHNPLFLQYLPITHTERTLGLQTKWNFTPRIETTKVTKQNSNETVGWPVDKALMHNFFPLYSISPAPIVPNVSSTDD